MLAAARTALPCLGHLQPFGDGFERSGVADENPQALLGLGRGVIQRLGVKHARADVFALQLGAELQQHRRTRLQHFAILRKPFGKQHGFEMAGRIGQTDDAHLVAGLGPPLHARDYGCGNLARGRAGFDSARKFRPGLHP